MTNFKKILIPVVVILGTLFVYNFIMSNPPEAQRRGASKAPVMTVEAVKLDSINYPVVIESYGTVQPRTKSALVSQVSGQINYVSDQFREGGFIEKGDILLAVDERDYLAEVNIAKAGYLSAQQVLLEEQAKAEQAATDWKRLGNGSKPSDLVLRKPQLDSAKAKLLSAEAQLDKAKLALERTKIRAPFAGRILAKSVDLGQVVNGNTKVADIYATDYVEIRLPIKNKDLTLITLPEEYRSSDNLNNSASTRLGNSHKNDVLFKSDLVGNQHWLGKIIRTEGAIDESSQQLYVVGQINDPFNKKASAKTPNAKERSDANKTSNVAIKIGQYVTAEIQGDTIKNAIVIPNKSIYQGSYVYVVVDGLLRRQNIEVQWQNAEEAIIKSGLKEGEWLVTTSLGQVSSGTAVSILGQEQKMDSQEKPKRPFGKRPEGKRSEGNRPAASNKGADK